ncbi:sensor domain-containing diguanylate cyclase [Bosea sp. TND4EK4]|uniref:sensor domain-containing diguanylate cyclase n=1 Tax=Bosea sp. TND4EK4 TaxID=1907408 RepID=UPI000956D393|nr:sensor domain-containing diguanylate cyclase [Bosea sp. TND4EK4]SIQ33907.1 diguanylate cyclase (GGDEF) domain-containing protein [Bosea sp. TND4EK4]
MILSRYLHDSLDMLGIGACEYDAELRAVSWNSAFLRFFPEHEGHIRVGEAYADNLRRFYAAGLEPGELPDIERCIAEGVARHLNQTQPFEFLHGGRRLRASSLPSPSGGRVRLWQSLDRRAEVVALTDAMLPVFEALRFIPDGATIVDGDDRIIVANDAFRQLYDLAENRVIVGEKLDQVLAEAWGDEAVIADRRATIRAGLRYDGAPFEVELPGGRWRRVLSRHSVEGIGCFIHADITSGKRQHIELLQAQEALHRANADLRLLSQTDALTGLANRRHFMNVLAGEAARAQKLALLIVDVDHFKGVNDQFGHVVGDACLKKVASLIGALPVPQGCTIARLGGEEFGLLLPGPASETALLLAEAVRGAFAQEPWHRLSPRLHGLTVSIGHCCAGGPLDGDALYASADDALYVAKRRGRDRVETAAVPLAPAPAQLRTG